MEGRPTAPFMSRNIFVIILNFEPDLQLKLGVMSTFMVVCRTCVAVAGDDYCIVAASTRMSTGFSILTRDSSMVLKL